jgi:Flp pilus assembly pilin Flp
MLTPVRDALLALCRDESGASLVEYVLICVLVSLAALVGTTLLGNTANNRVNNLGTVMEQIGS